MGNRTAPNAGLAQASSRLSRDISLDILKGIGIILVVVGHVFSSPVKTIIYTFHMPLFFFVGGYLSRPKDGILQFSAQKATQLLLPYISFLILLSLAQVSLNFVQTGAVAPIDYFALSVGGEMLDGWFGVFWFPTCYFLTIITYNALRVRTHKTLFHAILLTMVILAYTNQFAFPGFWLPWGANVILISLPIFHLGALFAEYQTSGRESRKLESVAIVFSIAYLALVAFELMPTLAMKRASYGLPIATVLAGIATTISLLVLSRQISKFPKAASVLAYLGTASLTIMYMHQPIQIIIATDIGIYNPYFRTGMAVTVSLGAHWFIGNHQISQRYLLGKRKSLLLPKAG